MYCNTIIYERKPEKPLIYEWNEKVASQYLDFVYIKTRKIKIFNRLYVLAASLITITNNSNMLFAYISDFII